MLFNSSHLKEQVQKIGRQRIVEEEKIGSLGKVNIVSECVNVKGESEG